MTEQETQRASGDTPAANGAPKTSDLGEVAKAAPAPDAAPAEAKNDAAAEEEMSFAEMFELAEKQSQAQRAKRRSEVERPELRPGQVLEGKIVSIAHETVFVDVGAKSEGVIDKSELAGEDGNFQLTEGDSVEVRVKKLEAGTVHLTKVLPHQSARTREEVRAAKESGTPLLGRVTGRIKGGYEVQVAGLRAFCPASQMDFRMSGDGDVYVGQKYPFRVTEFKDSGRNLVVSRRVILVEERERQAGELLQHLKEGAQVRGKVTSLKEYGAFVDIGGIEGLVHMSEVAHGHTGKLADHLSLGQEVDVQVLKIEDRPSGEKKISLSIKALVEDPWLVAQRQFKEGDKVQGKVARLQKFGAFVELLPGVDGLIHVSNMSLTERVNDPAKIVSLGDEIEATIMSIDWDKRRIGLSLVKTRGELAAELKVGKVQEATVDRIESFGIFVALESGARGLVPAAETGTERGADLSKVFEKGQKVKVVLLDKAKADRLRFSIRRAKEAEERAEYAGYLGDNQKSSGSGLGTLGELFKNKFAELDVEKR